MKPELILQADILDIIFDGRNKEYGAYQLRKDYETRIRKAMLFVLALVAALFFFNSLAGFEKQPSSNGTMIVGDTIIILPPPVAPPPVEPPRQRPASIENPSFVLTSADQTDTMPTVEELNQDVQIGLKSNIGDPFISDAPPPASSQAEAPSDVAVAKRHAPEEILKYAEVMPEFPGGQAAFIRFLSKHLRVPENSLEPGQKMKVIIRFVVDKEGGLSDPLFLQSGGEVFEQEVLRVLKKMPRWTPGSQNGEKVRVYFNLPIIFDAPHE